MPAAGSAACKMPLVPLLSASSSCQVDAGLIHVWACLMSCLQAVIVIETDHDNPLASSSGRKAFYSAFTTFNLAVMGRWASSSSAAAGQHK
jgi:hypothetical protein